MKFMFIFFLTILLFTSVVQAQNSDWKNFAIENQLPLDQVHPSNLPTQNDKKLEKYYDLFSALKNLSPEKQDQFLKFDYVSQKNGTPPLQMSLKDPKQFYESYLINGDSNKIDVQIRYQNGTIENRSVSPSTVASFLGRYSEHIAQKGDIKNLTPDPVKPKEKEAPVVVETSPAPAPAPEVKPQFDCQGELTKALNDFFKENREDFIKTQYRITSLKLAQKTKNNQKNNLEEMLKADQSQLTNIKNSDESITKLKDMYRAYGFEQDSKAIEEIEKLSKKSSNLNYYKGSQRLLNEDLSAYIMANIADSKNTLFDESDAATAWLFDEIQKQYLEMGNQKFGSQFNLMNLSSSTFLITNGAENSPEQIAKLLNDSENEMAKSYQEFLSQFKDQKKQCFENGESFENACDDDLLAMIEKGFSTDIKNLIKEMQSDSIKPEFDVNHLKLADSEISFNDLISSDISNLKPKKNQQEKTKAPAEKSTKKVVSANDFTNEIFKKIVFTAPFTSSKKMLNNHFQSNDYTTNIGICKVKVYRLVGGRTRVEMVSPTNRQSYNLTLSTNYFSTGATDQAVAMSLDKNFNKPHIRNSCLAN